MRPVRFFPLVILFVAGCISSVTKRIDDTNQQLNATNQYLASINEQMKETNARTIEMNQHLLATNAELKETNRRLQTIEKGLPRFPRLGAASPSVLPAERQPQAAE